MDYIFNEKMLYEILNAFHLLTGMKIVINDHNFNCFAAVPEKESDFCSALRENPEAVRRCEACKAEASLICRRKMALHIYKCHAGLVEVLSPIKIGDVTVGYMMLGQLLEDTDRDLKREDILSYANSLSLKDMTECYERLSVKNMTEIKAAAKLLESCACYLLMNKAIEENNANLAFKLSRYIEENIGNPNLTVDNICETFRLSRNRLYGISKTFFGLPIAEFIRKKRIDKAMEFIKSGVSVTDTAINVGFCDYGYFGKVFKTETGMSPTKYLKSITAKSNGI